MKKILAAAAITLATMSQPSLAGTCGAGKVTAVNIGWNNQEHLLVKIDYSEKSAVHSDKFANAWIRFPNTLSAARLQYLKNIALLALQSGHTVETYTHSNKCVLADEMTIIR